MFHAFGRRGIFKESHEYINKAIDSLRQLIKIQSQESGQQAALSSPAKYRLLLFMRYYAQIILQSCAIKS